MQFFPKKLLKPHIQWSKSDYINSSNHPNELLFFPKSQTLYHSKITKVTNQTFKGIQNATQSQIQSKYSIQKAPNSTANSKS